MIFWQDIRFALRAMTKARGMTVIALLTLALGIGANTAIFSIVNAALLRPLPFRDPGRLVRLRVDLRSLGAQNVGFSIPELDDLRDRAGIFESVCGVWPAPANLTGGEHPARVDFLGVGPNYFELLGARPQIGRLFDKRDVAEGFAEAVVLSDALWKNEFGGDEHIVGKQIRVDNDLYTIVGVLPADFRDPLPASVPKTGLYATTGFRANPFPPPLRKLRLLPGIIARLKPGITLQEAQTRLAAFTDAQRREYSADYPASAGWSLGLQPLKTTVVGNTQTLLLSIVLAVAMILLIACVNVASLLLAKSSARQREIAVRTALGASRARIVRQLLTEAAVLSVAAAVLGVIAALLVEKSLVAWLPRQLPQVNAVQIDGRVLLFSLGVAMLTSLLFGLAPALQTSRANANALKQDGRSGDATLHSSRTRKILVGVEVALSLMLVVGAGLLLRTFWDLLHVDPGFRSENVLAANVWLPVPNDPKTDVYATKEQVAPFVREVVRRLQQVPGVQSAALSNALPLRTQLTPAGYRIEGKDDKGDAPTALTVLVTPGFFQTVGATLVRGRMFTESDDEKGQLVALVNEAAARTFWPGEDPVGHRVRLARDFLVNGKLQPAPWLTVVGVVSNIKFSKLDEDLTPQIYAAMFQFPGKFFNVVVRATGDPAALGREIQRTVQSVDSNLPVSGVMPMTDVVANSVAERRFAASLIAMFALLALGLAAVGVYGVASYSVSQRMRELGIRAALGATATDLVRMVLSDGMAPVFFGLVAGCIGALLAGRAIASLLFGVRPTEIWIYVLSAATLTMIGFAANYIPARRAGQVDPNSALRCE
jgi:putative ABC transport system permease protein